MNTADRSLQPPAMSPISMTSNDSSFAGRYGAPPSSMGGTPPDAPYSGNPYGTTRPPPSQTSPPSSQHPSSSTDMSRPSQVGSSIGGRPPSSASSIASGRFGPSGRDSTRSAGAVNPHNEDALQRHYGALKRYLASSLQDEKGNVKPNRARDKLLRLSVTQFMELSTDVFDELVRREDERLQRVRDVPKSLPPKQNFHPKRNQARQKLSTLPLERFKQLATDVYYELERRIPRFAGGDISRPPSGASMRAPSRGGRRPPPGGFRPPPPGAGGRPPMSPGGPNGMGPPVRAKTFHSNTLVPNKSTMVEDDDEEEIEDEYGLNSPLNREAEGTSAEDKEKMESQENEISELKERIEELESKLQEKDNELERVESSGQDNLSSLRGDLEQKHSELEQKHLDAQQLNEDLRRELDQLHRDKSQDERDIRAQHDRNLEDVRTQLDTAHSHTDDLQTQLRSHQAENEDLRQQVQQGLQRQTSNGDQDRKIALLQEELVNQQKLTNEVREEATMYLHEMRDLSRQNDEAIEQEEKLAAQVSKLEKEIEEWRHRYAKVKAQNKNLRASTMGLGLQTSFDAGSLFRKEALISDGGLVKDFDVTRFQISVDELLKVARQTETNAMLDSVKNVIVCVQSITSAVGTDGYPTPAPSPLSPGGSAQQLTPVAKLKARVTGTANSLITATKQHASASGLSPVALLDAAASNLTGSIVELVKAVGIKPTPKYELEDAVDLPSIDATTNNHNSTNNVGTAHDSMGSFYDDRLEDSPPPPSTEPNSTSAPAVQITQPEQPATPATFGGLGRSNTLKKMNGWFNWGSKTPTDEAPPPPTPTMQGTHSATSSVEEYDPYKQ